MALLQEKPRSVKIVGALALGEALVVAGYGLAIIVFAAANHIGSFLSPLMLGIFFVLIGATIFWAAKMLVAAKSSGRSLLLVWQLFIVIIGVQTALAGQWLIGIPAVVLAAVVILLLFSTSVSHFVESARLSRGNEEF